MVEGEEGALGVGGYRERETFWLKILLESQGAAGEKVLLILAVNFTYVQICLGCNDVKRLSNS